MADSVYVPGSLTALFDKKPGSKKRKKVPDPQNSELFKPRVEKKKEKIKHGPQEPSVKHEKPAFKDQKGDRKPGSRKMMSSKRKIKTEIKPEEHRRTVFVGNLPTTLSEKRIKTIFSEFGYIDSIRFRSVVPSNLKMPKRAAVITKQYSENMHGVNVYIKFKEKESAELALSLNGMVIKKHHLRVDACWRKPELDNKRTIFVGNLPGATNEDQLWSFFEEVCGDIEGIRIVRDSFTGIGKGIAFVCFKQSASVELALKMNEHVFEERPLRISRAVNKEHVDSMNSKTKTRGKKMKLVSKLEDSHTLKNKGALKFMDSRRKDSVSKMIDKKKTNKKRKATGKDKSLMT